MLINPYYNKKRSIKESIIILLGTVWPLKIKQIHTSLKKEFNIMISYQGIHKSISELKEEQILIKTENGFQLSNEWINDNYNFFHKIKDVYRNNPIMNSVGNDENVSTLNLKTLIELDNFYFNLFEDIIPNSNKKSVIFCLKHNWRPLLYPHKEHELLKQNQKKYYFLNNGETKLDKWCSDFERKSKAKVLNGSNYSPSCDIYIVDNLIIQIYLHKELIQKVEQIFATSKNSKEVNINNLIQNIFERKSKIVIIINKNEDLVNQMKNQIISLFEKNNHPK